MEWKKFVGPLVVGVGVVLLTPLLAGLVDGVAILSTAIFAGLTIGSTLAAGVAAFVSMWVVNEYIMKI
jgi:hypothetical protein